MGTKDKDKIQFTDDEEIVDAPPDNADQENEDDELESEKISDTDEEAEDPEDAEDNAEDTDDLEENGENIEKEGSDEKPDEIALLKQEISALKEQLSKPKSPENTQPVKHTYTEEEKAKISEIAKAPFETVEFFNGMLVNAINQIKGYVESQLGEVNKSSAIEKFSKSREYSDAMKYREGMEEYLSKQPANLRSKPETLELAYHVARSKALKSTVQKVIANKDKNKRIVTVGRPKVGESKGKNELSLTEDEVRMAKMAKIPLSEYAKYKKPLVRINQDSRHA